MTNKITLETPRLHMRDFKKSDWQEAHEYAQDPEVSKFMIWGPNTVEQTKEFIDRALHNQQPQPRVIFDFAVILRETNKLIGAGGLTIIPGEPEQAMIGYTFNRHYWGQGYATETSKALISFGFRHLGMHRIAATCDLENLASARVLGKSGMRREAHFVQEKKLKGKWRDTLVFAILHEEWLKNGGDK